MIEDMRERFEKWAAAKQAWLAALSSAETSQPNIQSLLDQLGKIETRQWRDEHGREIKGALWIRRDDVVTMLMRASAGTSGTPDRCPLCESQVREIRLCLICDTSHKTELYSNRQCIAAGKPNFCSDPWHRGDSLSGKGGATKEVMPSGSPSTELGHDSSTPRSDKGRGAPSGQQETSASAPDRAEELARLKATIDQVLCRRIKHIGDVDQLYTGYPNQLIDELVTAVASLLREAEGRCPTCGLTIVPRLCANPACASSVRR